MQAINELLMEVNDDIMAANAEIVDFNSENLQISAWTFEHATPEKNKERIEKNSKDLDACVAEAQKVKDELEGEDSVGSKVTKTCSDLAKARPIIEERRAAT